jgi:hypothetical protein
LGWTPDRFGTFDSGLSQHGRESKKAERIGKKYQWLAYHEFLARLLDHRPYNHDWHGATYKYEGPWQLNVRDNDPSQVLKPAAATESTHDPWWIRVDKPSFDTGALSDDDWLADHSSIPSFDRLIEVNDPTGSSWYNLCCANEWQEPEHSSSLAHGRRVTFSLGSFIMRSHDAASFVDAAQAGEWTGQDVAPLQIHDRFLGEYSWAPSFADLRKDAGSAMGGPYDQDNSQVHHLAHTTIPAVRTVASYSSDFRFDCSRKEAFSRLMPSVWMAQRLKLRWHRHEFEFVDSSGSVIALDPSADDRGDWAFVAARGELNRFLAAEDFSLVWLLIGEKSYFAIPMCRPCHIKIRFLCSDRCSGLIATRYARGP